MSMLLVRGMLCGVLAGLLAFGFAWLFGEPQVDLAIAFEAHMQQLAHDPPEPELVSRAVQSTLGLFTATMVYSTALGGVFALAFAYAYGRMGRLSARATALVLALAGLVVLIITPQLKYPANPPSIGNPETIGARTALYFEMIALSVAAAMLGLPPVNEVPAAFSATTLWKFRLASMGINTVVWVTIGLAFGALTQRQLALGVRRHSGG
jgi:predicted cobalt transporter CbtA